MQISVLASGSKGNCLLISERSTAVLIDAGISTRKIKQKLAALHMDINDLAGILITHEHSDHVRGLNTLTKKHHIPIYSQSATFKAMPAFAQLYGDCCNPLTNDVLTIGNLQIEHFPISHDAASPVGYSIKTAKQKFTLATDLGFVSDTVKQALNGSNIIVLEANHDINMLQNGTYPWSLKKRILGTRGHLSNSDAGWTLHNLPFTPDEVILAHLSEQNNTPANAVATINNILANAPKPKQQTKFTIDVAAPDATLSFEFS